MKDDGSQRGRDWPKRTWIEVVKIDIKKCNLLEDLAQEQPREKRKNKH